MRGIVIGLGLIVLLGCSDPVSEAQKELRFVQESGSLDDICSAYRKLEAIALTARNAEQLQAAKIRGDAACYDARMGFDPRSGRKIEPDDLEARP